MATTKPNLQLNFPKRYKNYEDFYDENKPKIYSSIVEIFKGFKDKRKKTLYLGISAHIEGCEWNTEMRFNRDEFIVLKRDVLPFFEQAEEYEVCLEIKNLYNEFTL